MINYLLIKIVLSGNFDGFWLLRMMSIYGFRIAYMGYLGHIRLISTFSCLYHHCL